MFQAVAWFQEPTSGTQTTASAASWLSWVPVAALVVSLITLFTILFFRWRDSRTTLKITYSVGEPEHPADMNDLRSELHPREPALYVKVINKGKTNVRLHNVFIELKRGPVAFEGLVNLTLGAESIRQVKAPGEHWFFYQRMFQLGGLLKEQGCGETTRFKLVVRDWSGRLHKKTIQIDDVEHWAALFGPQTEMEKPRQSWWQKHFGRC